MPEVCPRGRVLLSTEVTLSPNDNDRPFECYRRAYLFLFQELEICWRCFDAFHASTGLTRTLNMEIQWERLEEFSIMER